MVHLGLALRFQSLMCKKAQMFLWFTDVRKRDQVVGFSHDSHTVPSISLP